ncbi:MAG: hypothetical protein KAW19_07105 [Candidatus Aminicenantes bacterium]|nr:hypothetical protein [Candidatus Aminicenantes bacterium]
MKNTKEKSKFSRFFSKQVLNVRTIMTIIGIILAIYFYSETKTKRELKYYCHPVKTTVVKAGQTSSLEISSDEEKIESDVTAIQVAIWNNGKKSIKRDNILETITLYTEPNTPIIDAVVRKHTREVIDLSIDRSSFKEGFIPISWRILEHNDGGIIQVIFAGSPDVEILTKGTIEGQRPIKRVRYFEKVRSPKEQMEFDFLLYRIMAYTYLAGAIILAILLIRGRFRNKKASEIAKETINAYRKGEISEEERREKVRKETERLYKKFKILNIVSREKFRWGMVVVGFAIFLILMLFSKDKGPPFGF